METKTMETETKPKAPPPSKEEARAANAGEYAGNTRVVKKIGGNKVLKAVLGGGIAVAGGAIAYETVPAFHQAVDSAFLDHIKGKSLSTETSTNPEVFNPTAREGVITDKNTIRMTWGEYAKIAPSTVNKEAPEELNILFPIQFPEGSANRALQIKKGKDYMGGGVRKLSSGADGNTKNGELQVMNSLTIEDGLKEGDILISPASGMIEGLKITGEDEAGNTYGILLVGLFTSSRSANFKFIKDIPPSKTEEFEPGKFRTTTFPVPIKAGEPIGIITKPTKGPLGMAGAGGIGQFQMLTFSTVTVKDGTKQVGAVAARINTSPDGKIYILK